MTSHCPELGPRVRRCRPEAKFLESAILILPVVDGVFDVICQCSCDIVGLN